jgi:uncharacterized protein (DUF1015 family)
MADVTPFRGIRYRDDIALDDVVAPPYDVLSAAQAEGLRRRSPYNAVHVDLPVTPGATANDEDYATAAATYRRWLTDGVLRRDETPSLTLIDQDYRGPDGRSRTRRGVVTRLRLADLADGVVLPHELTHDGPKVDRLKLYRATHADISQIFLLFADDDGSVGALLDAAAREAPSAAAREARDDDGTVHRVVPIAGAAAERFAAGLRDKSLYIADGHHRYETALAYRDERRAAGDHSADTLMVYLCSMDDPGLTVFPTHRLLRDVPIPPLPEMLERLHPLFETVGEPVYGTEAAHALLEKLPEQADPGRVFGLYLAHEDACLVVRSREPLATQRLRAGGHSGTAAGLSVTVLHELIFHDILGLSASEVAVSVDYAKSVPDALAELRQGSHGLGAFLNATRVSQVRAIADNGETMPQKSTYFYPKLLTGLVYDSLGD